MIDMDMDMNGKLKYFNGPLQDQHWLKYALFMGPIDGSLMGPSSKTNFQLKLPKTLAENTICVAGILTHRKN